MEVRESLHFTAEADFKKLDYFLRTMGVSRRIITKLKYQDGLLINGESATTIRPVYTGDTVTVCFPKENTLSCEPQVGPLDILYEDIDLLALNKPNGIATHPALGTKDHTLGNFVSQYYQDENTPLPFRPVSRLDKETSGVILVAKHSYAHSVLSEQMRSGVFQKKYLALVFGIPKESSGVIDFPIIEEDAASLRRVCRADGKKAYTKYRVLSQKNPYSLLEIEITTGRTHQIRVHLNEIGHPIVGDPLYGNVPGKRLYLHSYATSFLHPVTKEALTLNAPCNFETILQNIENEEFPL